MRYFIALRFDEDVKNQLSLYQSFCVDQGILGKGTTLNNLHLTLLFIGSLSTEEVEKLTLALSSVKAHSFCFTVSGLGVFKRQSRFTLWAKPQSSKDLLNLHQLIVRQVQKCSISVQTTEFIPHITLFRNSKSSREVDFTSIQLPMMHVKVSEFYLMKSWHDQGVLTYTPIQTYLLESHE